MIPAFPHLFCSIQTMVKTQGVHSVHVSSEKRSWLFRLYRGLYYLKPGCLYIKYKPLFQDPISAKLRSPGLKVEHV